ncbi:MAG: ABC transporter permease [Paracoccaceae bacterium]
MTSPTAPAPTFSPVQRVGRVRFQSLRIITALILREAASRFGNTTGGYLWSFAEPVAGILLLSVAFSYLLASPPIGDSFFLFYTSGVVPLLFFNALSSALAQSVTANKGLLTYPIVSVLDVIVARSLLETLTYGAVFSIIVVVTVQMDDIDLRPDLLQIIAALLLVGLLGMAVGMTNCILFLYFPMWRNIWRILTRPMLIISGVMFTYDSMPQELQHWLWFNPVLQIIGLMRGGIYASYNDSYVSIVYIVLLSAMLIAVSGYFIRMEQSRLIQQ